MNPEDVELMMEQGKYSEALSLVQRLLESMSDTDASSEMATLSDLIDFVLPSLFLINDESRGEFIRVTREMIDEMVFLSNTDEERLRSYINLSNWYSLDENDDDEALRVAEEAQKYITDKESEVRVLARIANCCCSAKVKDTGRAIELYPRIIGLDIETNASIEDLALHRFLYGLSLKQAGDVNQARKEYRESIRLSGGNEGRHAIATHSLATFMLGGIYYESGKLGKAEKYYKMSWKEAQKLNQDTTLNLLMLARTYYFEEKHKSAFETYRLLLQQLEEGSKEWNEVNDEYNKFRATALESY